VVQIGFPGIPYTGSPVAEKTTLLGSSVNRGRAVSLLALYLIAFEDFHQCRRNISMVCQPAERYETLLQERLSLFPHLKDKILGRNGFGHRS
jgi:hypothetical protein